MAGHTAWANGGGAMAAQSSVATVADARATDDATKAATEAEAGDRPSHARATPAAEAARPPTPCAARPGQGPAPLLRHGAGGAPRRSPTHGRTTAWPTEAVGGRRVLGSDGGRRQSDGRRGEGRDRGGRMRPPQPPQGDSGGGDGAPAGALRRA